MTQLLVNKLTFLDDSIFDKLSSLFNFESRTKI
ncbi:unnamed protein product [Schistosoma curassoni]|uniref:Transcriptional regulator n=1 Tax=Schistosoma curassoni TaxID=6186 RepID=A0A183JSA7_9TREM|nr:unnamed protein product [Schistosoma curassoni]